mmetsp:Transcript_136996/g.381943  ORF Transcript_136996/g.381943 Transcript_136996/m.381943 type:complete len:211 (+) Transcript_136996:54-686(+)
MAGASAIVVGLAAAGIAALLGVQRFHAPAACALPAHVRALGAPAPRCGGAAPASSPPALAARSGLAPPRLPGFAHPGWATGPRAVQGPAVPPWAVWPSGRRSTHGWVWHGVLPCKALFGGPVQAHPFIPMHSSIDARALSGGIGMRPQLDAPCRPWRVAAHLGEWQALLPCRAARPARMRPRRARWTAIMDARGTDSPRMWRHAWPWALL